MSARTRCTHCHKLFALSSLQKRRSPKRYCRCPKFLGLQDCHDSTPPRNLTTEVESQTDFSDHNVNIELNLEKCSLHPKMIEYICWTDQEKICSDCVIFGKHRDPSSHDIRSLSLIKELIDPKLKCLEDLLPKIETFWEKTKDLLEKQKKAALSVIHSRFYDLKMILNAKEAELKWEIGSFYDKEIKKLCKQVGEDSFAMKILNEKIHEYQEITKSPKPIELLEENLSGTFNIIQESLNLEKVNIMEEVLQQINTNIDLKLSNLLSDFKMMEGVPENLSWMWGETDLKLNEKLYSRWELEKYKKSYELSSEIIGAPRNDIIRSEDKIVISYPFQTQLIRDLDLILQDAKKITSLKFEIMETSETMGNEDISKLFYIQSKLGEIKELEISIKDFNISDRALSDVFSVIFCGKITLTKICLTYNMEGTFEKSIQYLAGRVLPCAPFLKEFTLNFENSKSENNAYNSLIQSLSKVAHNLTNLHFVIKCKDTDSSSLQRLFVRMPKLKSLAYQMNSRAFSDQVLGEFISKTLPSLRNLTDFELSIHGSSVTDLSVKKLFRSFPEEWFFTLNVFRVGLNKTEITDESFNHFVKVTLGKFKALKSFGVYAQNRNLSPSMREKLSNWELKFSEDSNKD